MTSRFRAPHPGFLAVANPDQTLMLLARPSPFAATLSRCVRTREAIAVRRSTSQMTCQMPLPISHKSRFRALTNRVRLRVSLSASHLAPAASHPKSQRRLQLTTQSNRIRLFSRSMRSLSLSTMSCSSNLRTNRTIRTPVARLSSPPLGSLLWTISYQTKMQVATRPHSSLCRP